ncbi:hypothetical protein PAAG_12087 [Paracoccidioides lutzii Pb01]|uniref:Uncharacterized protein n=1 Tax=Paracoccidioides lutzii (strain ATCC MYA-826 / Pb01) TaxID=502779 RepID=A0A0A2VK25_PARBA|nr:hypothetical protein PAAG_12087 [Paracoccidioides lutzii Pb01]KGQ01229.1 hypothetical protein PAAG_12087 [Paracoccidioides lutzii Pb01]
MHLLNIQRFISFTAASPSQSQSQPQPHLLAIESLWACLCVLYRSTTTNRRTTRNSAAAADIHTIGPTPNHQWPYPSQLTRIPPPVTAQPV